MGVAAAAAAVPVRGAERFAAADEEDVEGEGAGGGLPPSERPRVGAEGPTLPRSPRDREDAEEGEDDMRARSMEEREREGQGRKRLKKKTVVGPASFLRSLFSDFSPLSSFFFASALRRASSSAWSLSFSHTSERSPARKIVISCMSLRQLATGAGDGCSADGAGGSGDASSAAAGPSNPLGGLADALLGRPSKAHERAHEVRRASGGCERVRGGASSRGLAAA